MADQPNSKRAGGRPTKYKPEYCKTASNYIKLGASDNDIAEFLEVALSTLNLWKLEHKEFSESIKRSKEQHDALIERSLRDRAYGYSHKETKVFCNNGEITTKEVIKHYPPDPTSMIFWLKNRQPEKWRDKREVTAIIDTDDVNDLELARRVAFLLTEEEYNQEVEH
jgi:hypothetical protein